MTAFLGGRDAPLISSMDFNQQITRSRRRLKRGVRLTFFLLVVALAALFFGAVWLAKLGGGAAGVFALVTLMELGNVRRLRGLAEPAPPQRKTRAMSVEEARALVDDLVSKGEELFATPPAAASQLPEGLGPITREFFSRYGTLKTRRGGFELSLAGIRASEYVEGSLSIGHSEDWDVVQRLGKDEVFVVEGADIDIETGFPSVYHLAVDEAMQA